MKMLFYSFSLHTSTCNSPMCAMCARTMHTQYSRKVVQLEMLSLTLCRKGPLRILLAEGTEQDKKLFVQNCMLILVW